MDNNLLLKISNPYIFKDLLYYIDMVPALELIRYNKKLQNRLKIDKNIYESNSNCIIVKRILYKDYRFYEFAQFFCYANFYFIIYSLFHSEIKFLLKTAKILFVLYIFLLIYLIYEINLKIENIFQFKFLIFFVFMVVLLEILNILKIKYILPIISIIILKKIISFLVLIIILYIFVNYCFCCFENMFDSNYNSTRKSIIKLLIFIHGVYEYMVALKLNILEKKNGILFLIMLFFLLIYII